jgi:predicted aminopeptidase
VTGRWAVSAIGAGMLLAGCMALGGPGYLARAAWSEATILWRREPITAVLARPELDPARAGRLRLALEVREFARDVLGLSVGDSYSTYVDVDDRAPVHVVSAAYRDRLEAYTWRYPIVGRLPYRGFFDRDAADAAAARLGAQGLDVDVRPAGAFSTLGWFADPLLSSVAAEPPVGLAETIIHELFHATVWRDGEAAFNESAATWMGHRGAIAFFCPGGPGADAARCEEARRRWAVTRARGRLFARLARRLGRLYGHRLPPRVRDGVRARLAARAGAALERDGIGRRSELVPANNARLLGLLLYTTGLDDFDRAVPLGADLRAGLSTLASATEGS